MSAPEVPDFRNLRPEPEAEQRLRALVGRDPGHAEAANDLAWLLADQGDDLDIALSLAERAARLAPAKLTTAWISALTSLRAWQYATLCPALRLAREMMVTS